MSRNEATYKMPTLEQFFVWHGVMRHERRVVLPFHCQIFVALLDWINGNLGQNKRNLAICMPPRHGKTYIARDLVAWGLAMWPDSEWIYTSYSATLAVNQTVQIKNCVSADYYRAVFPYVGVLPGKGRQDYFTTPAGGSVYGVGVGGTITGFGAGKKRRSFGGGIVIDDPLQAQDAYSEAKREGCNIWYTQTLYSRRNSDKTPVLLIMQRLHEQDLVGYLLEREPELWHVMQIPVRDKSGDTLWPETFSKESAERLALLDPFAYSAQYLQQPTPAGGAMIRRDVLQLFAKRPDNLVRAGIFADTAFKTGEYNDYSVLTYAATEGRNCYILDIDRGKWTAPELLEHAKAFWEKHKPHRINNPLRFVGMRIEDKASGTGLIQTLKSQTAIPVIPVQRNRDKVSRVNDILPYIHAGRLFIREKQQWTEPLISELCAFSPAMTHQYDDQVDTVVDAIDILLAPDGGRLAGADWS